jgi:hypothetical protein
VNNWLYRGVNNWFIEPKKRAVVVHRRDEMLPLDVGVVGRHITATAVCRRTCFLSALENRPEMSDIVLQRPASFRSGLLGRSYLGRLTVWCQVGRKISEKCSAPTPLETRPEVPPRGQSPHQRPLEY